MDGPQPVSTELERHLENLRQLNRLFGSYSLISHFLHRWIKSGTRLRIVDLATGSGDIPRLIVDHTRKVGGKVQIDALDRQPGTLEIAKRLSAGYPEISFIEANILEWRPQERYDIALCSLVLHHFSEQDAILVLRRCQDISRNFVLVADLRRGLLASVGVYLLTALIFRNPMLRHDGRLSAARAFSFVEFAKLARQAGWRDFGHGKFPLARQAVWVEKKGNRLQ